MLDTLDSFDDKIVLYIDSNKVVDISPSGTTSPSNICGTSYRDTNIILYGMLPHFETTLTIKVFQGTNYDPTDESLGFRDLSFIFETAPTLPSASICEELLNSPATNNVALYQVPCSCRKGYYHKGVTCVPCHDSCASCFGSSSGDCYSCKPGYFFDGSSCRTFTCSVTYCTVCDENDRCISCSTDYALLKNMCIGPNTCPLPYKHEYTATGRVCAPPCKENKFFYPDSTCRDSCETPNHISMIQNYPRCIRCTADPLCKTCSDLPGKVCRECTDTAILHPDGVCRSNSYCYNWY